jgi:hypothetical protein
MSIPRSSTMFTPILTKQSLAERVERLVLYDRMKYSEAILEVCAEMDIDPADIIKLIISSPLYAKIEAEAMRFNVIPKTSAAYGNVF